MKKFIFLQVVSMHTSLSSHNITKKYYLYNTEYTVTINFPPTATTVLKN